MILTHQELVEITDLVQFAAQIRWLQEHGWKFEIGASGRPKVLRAERDRKMLGGAGAKAGKEKRLNDAAYA